MTESDLRIDDAIRLAIDAAIDQGRKPRFVIVEPLVYFKLCKLLDEFGPDEIHGCKIVVTDIVTSEIRVTDGPLDSAMTLLTEPDEDH